MAVSFFSFTVTNQFPIADYGIGPTEIRMGYFALNTFVAAVGSEISSRSMPVMFAMNGAAFLILTAQTSCNLWWIDGLANVDGQQR